MNYVLPPGSAPSLHRELLDRLYDKIDQLDGSISAEHGVGRAKRDAVSRRKPAASQNVSRCIKRALDPHNLLNPGVILAHEEDPT